MGIPSKAGRTSLDGAWASCRRVSGADGAGWPDAPPPPLPPAPCAEFLDALPDSIVQLHLLPRLDPSDKRALRATCSHARELVNAAVSRVRIAAGDLLPPDAPGAAAPRLGRRFPGLAAVEAFDCADAPVTDEALTDFLDSCGDEILSQITEVNVKRCNYVGRALLHWLRARCPALARLSASRWTDNVTLHAIARLEGLTDLDLSESDALDDAGLLPLRTLPRLRVLGLGRCRWIGDAGCRTLAQITGLEDLTLASTDVGAAGLAELASLPRLARLDISDCRRVDDAALAHLGAATGLDTLALRNTEVHAEGLAHLRSLGRLAQLDLGSRFELNNDGLESLAACSSLACLAVGSFNLTRAPPPGFGASLERLRFGGGFANKGLDLLFPLPRLRSLHASGIDTVTDRVMRTVSSQTSLRELSLRSGYSLTRDGLMALARLSNLSALSVASCPAIGDEALAALRDGRGAAVAAAAAAAAAATALAAPVALPEVCPVA